ncbi:kinase-like domain-containing protein [Zychaea mexicana]|uniref:kinase-like domain-containing protein n=1 Tax=Zychaea mexicana TaxID=64656 RepID=UPI0022FE3C9E|nr:kinase-like domain-containing protein [Zychaea mexicana]KAI9489035.1 kinase-like domain-containing protein [Zychaea mexicana]
MQENDHRNARRSSEAEVQLNRPEHTTRVPLPLPYLPSDYEPSPTSPRHRFLTHPLTGAATTPPIPLAVDAPSSVAMGRQRSRSTSYQQQQPDPALVTALSSSILSAPSPEYNPSDIMAIAPLSPSRSSFEIVPYREWTVISKNDVSGQMVLYNRESRMVTVRQQVPSETQDTSSSSSMLLTPSSGECPLCHRPFPRQNTNSEEGSYQNNEPDFMDRNYFRLLASTTPVQSPRTTHGQTSTTPPLVSNIRLNANAFNEGYYEKFFVERKKLGRGFRGSVYLCEHELDGVKLGKYAVKKVAVGNNHPWLVKMLREVHLLERLRHPNIISYKHAWLEYNRLTPFGPEIPCLFILMECANGGNLEEYMEPEILPSTTEKPSSSSKPEAPKSAKQRKRERIKRQLQEHQQTTQESAPSTHTQKRLLSMPEIWSLFLDIVEGLAHLHQQNIVHRDLKPPNLLLKWDERKRAHDQPNEWRGAFDFRGIPRVLISDFGECEDLEGVPDNDRTGATGTLEFMAPEHVRMDPRGRHMKEFSPKADMWSLGMVLYYLCYTRLPYTNVDDIDLLQEEILSIREVEFPKNRFDIYKNQQNLSDPTLSEAMRHQDVPEHIPPELKLLIRMLLSTDPDKRPSCEEILSKLRQMPQPLYVDESTMFGSSATTTTGAATTDTTTTTTTTTQGCNGKGTSPTSSKMKRARRSSWRTQDGFFSPNMIKNEPSVLDIGSKIQAIPADEEIKMNDDGSQYHHQQGSGEGTDGLMDSLMEEIEQDNAGPSRNVKRESSQGSATSKRRKKDTDCEDDSDNEFLIGSGSLTGPSAPATEAEGLRSDMGVRTVKSITAFLKIATCTYPCYPYAPSPAILYPVIILAMMDFYSESVSHSLLLVAMHVAWVVIMAVLSNGICVA